MKQCYACKTKKSLDEFSDNKSRYDGKNGQCKLCHSAYRKDHYEKNKNKVYKQIKKRQRGLSDKVLAYKEERGCSDCGIKDGRVLDYDHLKDKVFNISQAGHYGYSWENILAEIEKCDIVCSNCHRIRTWERRNNAGLV